MPSIERMTHGRSFFDAQPISWAGSWLNGRRRSNGEVLAELRAWKPEATIVTNVEFYAAVVMHLAGVPQDLFTATFAVSRIAGWSAHVLEQCDANKIIRPAARYVGPPPPGLVAVG